jgi:pimeloyl-ACP methyl ester carboxylesterase
MNAGVRRNAKWVRVISWLAVLFVTYLGVLWFFQRKLLFPRPPLSGAPARPSDARQIWLSIPNAEVEAWYLPPFGVKREPAPLLIFFHGNGELIDYWPREFTEPRGLGFGVLLVEFPGYGRSGGTPSQATVRATALAAYDWAVSQPFVDRARVVAYGRSLGGGAATILASERPVSALVLESTFTSVRSFAHRFWAPELVVRDPFDSLSLLPQYAGPVLVLHGDRDQIIPPDHARRLARAARRSELHLMPCGHNDCPRPWSIIRDFLVTSELLAPTLRIEDR